MKKLKLSDEIEILMNDEVLKGTVDSISTRENYVERVTYYTFKLDKKGWSLQLSYNENLGEVDNV